MWLASLAKESNFKHFLKFVFHDKRGSLRARKNLICDILLKHDSLMNGLSGPSGLDDLLDLNDGLHGLNNLRATT